MSRWAGGAWHVWTDTSNIELTKQQFVSHNIYVVNETFSLMHGCLKVVDEILHDHFDIGRPWNVTAVDLNQIVRQTNSQECADAGAAGGSSGSLNTNAENGGGAGGDDGTVSLAMNWRKYPMALSNPLLKSL